MAGIIGIPGRLQSEWVAAFARNRRPNSSESAPRQPTLTLLLQKLLKEQMACRSDLPRPELFGDLKGDASRKTLLPNQARNPHGVGVYEKQAEQARKNYGTPKDQPCSRRANVPDQTAERRGIR